MVTTRSADKRVEGRDEDLVLRSRTVMSPASQETTPSRLRKRGSTGSKNVTPVQKRARIIDDVRSNTSNPTVMPEERVIENDDQAKMNPINQLDPVPDARGQDGDSAGSDSTPRQREVFRTPATSRHKRYDSAESEDTIVLNTNPAPVSQRGYETAEEIMEDSDEAPEISTTKVQTVLHVTGGKTSPKTRSRARASDFFDQVREKDSDVVPSSAAADRQVHQELEDAVQASLDECILTESTDPVAQPHTTPEIVDAGATDTQTSDPELRKTQSAVLPEGVTADVAVPFEATEPNRPSEGNSAETIASIKSLRDTEMLQASENPNIKTGANTIKTFDDQESSSERIKIISVRGSRPTMRVSSKQLRSDTRLPERNKTSRSNFMHRQLQSRGLRLDSTWPTKRSAFVTS